MKRFSEWARVFAKRLAQPASHNRQIAIAFIWLSFFVLIGRTAGAAKEMAIAWRYGLSPEVDAYVLLFNVTTWPAAVWLSLLSSVLVPTLANAAKDARSVHQFSSELLLVSILLGIGLCALLFFALPALLRSGALGLPVNSAKIALQYTTPLAAVGGIALCISFLSCVVMGSGSHKNTLMEALPALAILVAVLTFSGHLVSPLVGGTLIGYAVQFAVLLYLAVTRFGLKLPELRHRSSRWRPFARNISILAAGQILMSSTTIIDSILAARLPTGSLSTLSYSTRVLSLVLGVGALAIARATLPVFSAIGTRNEVSYLAKSWTKWMFAGGVLTSAALWVFSECLVAALFQRGSFTADDVRSVAQIFRVGILQVPFYFAGLVLVSALSATGQYKAIAVGAALNMVIKVVFAFSLVHHVGLIGLMASTVLMYVGSTVFLTAIVLRDAAKPSMK